MKTDELFDSWKQHNSDFEVSDSFCNDIMQVVNTPKNSKAKTDFLAWFNTVTLEPLIRFSAITVSALGGFCRIVLTFYAMVSENAPLI